MVQCAHCETEISRQDAVDGWCSECGKKIPAFLLAELKTAIRDTPPAERPPAAVTEQPRAPARPPRRGRQEDVLVHTRFRPFLALLIGVFFLPVGVLFLLPGVFGLQKLGSGEQALAWGTVLWLAFLTLLGAAFLIVAVGCFIALFNYLVHGKGPPVLALREDALFDYRTAPPLVLAWDDVRDVDVVVQSENGYASVKTLLVYLRDGKRHDLDVRGLDVGVWELKRLAEERAAEGPPSPRQAPAAFDPGITIAPSRAKAPVGLGAPIATFPYRPRGLQFFLGLVTLVSLFVAASVALGKRVNSTLIAAGVLAVLAPAAMAWVYYWGRDRIQVCEHGVVSRGFLLTRTYPYEEINGVLIYSVDNVAEAVVLKMKDGRSVKLRTGWDRVGELYALINSRV